jgi:hypothetical protein
VSFVVTLLPKVVTQGTLDALSKSLDRLDFERSEGVQGVLDHYVHLSVCLEAENLSCSFGKLELPELPSKAEQTQLLNRVVL